MRLALSTNWNSARHEDGAAAFDEIAALGFDAVELGYSLSFGQAEEAKRRVRAGTLRVVSIHAFCPNPLPGAHAGPEPFSLCDPADFARSRRGIKAVLDSARFASEIGAPKMVLHAGRAPVFRAAMRLQRLVEDGKRATPAYERLLARFQDKRARKVRRPFDTLCDSLEILLPQLRPLGVTLCLENLPTADAIPDEAEMDLLLREFEGEPLASWHDIGHGRIRHELGLAHQAGLVRRSAASIGGFHVHDVLPPLRDHNMPPGGLVDFSIFAPFAAREDVPLVFEPAPGLPAADVARGLAFLRGLWKV